MGPGGRHLDVVDVPAVVGAGAIGGEVESANRGGKAGSAAAENVEIAPLEVVVVGSHQPSPGLQVPDLDAVAVAVVEPHVDVGVRPSLDDRPGPDVNCVHAIRVLHVNNKMRKQIKNPKNESRT